MRVENHPGEISSHPQCEVDVTEMAQEANERENGSRRVVVPAKLPLHSQAAIAQRFNALGPRLMIPPDTLSQTICRLLQRQGDDSLLIRSFFCLFITIRMLSIHR
jgi:hypothetical protein